MPVLYYKATRSVANSAIMIKTNNETVNSILDTLESLNKSNDIYADRFFVFVFKISIGLISFLDHIPEICLTPLKLRGKKKRRN